MEKPNRWDSHILSVQIPFPFYSLRKDSESSSKREAFSHVKMTGVRIPLEPPPSTLRIPPSAFLVSEVAGHLMVFRAEVSEASVRSCVKNVLMEVYVSCMLNRLRVEGSGVKGSGVSCLRKPPFLRLVRFISRFSAQKQLAVSGRFSQSLLRSET